MRYHRAACAGFFASSPALCVHPGRGRYCAARVALLRRHAAQPDCLRRILRYSVAHRAHDAESVLRGGVALLAPPCGTSWLPPVSSKPPRPSRTSRRGRTERLDGVALDPWRLPGHLTPPPARNRVRRPASGIACVFPFARRLVGPDERRRGRPFERPRTLVWITGVALVQPIVSH